MFWMLVAVVLSLLGLSENISLLYTLYSPTRCRISQSSRTCFMVSTGMPHALQVWFWCLFLYLSYLLPGCLVSLFTYLTFFFFFFFLGGGGGGGPILLVLLLGVGLWISHGSPFRFCPWTSLLLCLLFWFFFHSCFVTLHIPFIDFKCYELFHSLAVVADEPVLHVHSFFSLISF